jgi:hypothetical protein
MDYPGSNPSRNPSPPPDTLPPVDTMPNCFHLPNWTNIHYHGFHVTPNSPQEPRLDLITVATRGETVLRRFQFEHDYSIGRLTLV